MTSQYINNIPQRIGPFADAVHPNFPHVLRYPLDFTIIHLNIHGLDDNLDCKIPYLEKTVINDINPLTETWSWTHDKNIPNFLTLELPPNKLDERKTGRSSGGTLIYYKNIFKIKSKSSKFRKTVFGWK